MAGSENVLRSYLGAFAATLALALGATVAAALYVEPLDGELTRLGSYPERDFGWNLPQRRLPGGAKQVEAFAGGGDLLVVGDSFSTNGVWQPFLARETGLAWRTLEIGMTSLPGLIGSRAFRDDPPRIVIVQSVERDLLNRFENLGFACDERAPAQFAGPLPPLERQESAQLLEERRPRFAPARMNLRYAAAVVGRTLARRVRGGDSGTTRRFRLTTDGLFSNRRSGEILVYAGDLDTHAWRTEQVERAACAVRGLQDAVEDNGTTLFLFVLAPDKSSAYAPYIADQRFRRRRETTQLLVDRGVRAVRVDRALARAIAAGERDIYTPNGTHWSPRGYEIAAAAIAGHLRDLAARVSRGGGG